MVAGRDDTLLSSFEGQPAAPGAAQIFAGSSLESKDGRTTRVLGRLHSYRSVQDCLGENSFFFSHFPIIMSSEKTGFEKWSSRRGLCGRSCWPASVDPGNDSSSYQFCPSVFLCLRAPGILNVVPASSCSLPLSLTY